MKESLSIALKEWATVCHALESGQQLLLLRKGGIHEAAGGFELEHSQFLLFPTYLHQNLTMLKPEAHRGFEPHSAEPQKITLSGAAEVSDIIQLKNRSQMDVLDAQHIWTAPLIDMRFNYKPQNPLYLILLRVYKLAEPITVDNTPAYAGCKSWVPLGQEVLTKNAVPVFGDEEFDARQRKILTLLPL